MNSADQIDQLNALRFKMQSQNKNLQREKSEKILGNAIPGMSREIQKAETYSKYVGSEGKLKSGIFGKHGDFAGAPGDVFSEIQDGSLIEWVLFT